MKKQTILCSILFFFFVALQAQDLLNSRQSGYYSFIYKISTSEAKTLYKKQYALLKDSYFHTLIDSFPADCQYTGELKPGHYLKVSFVKNLMKADITAIGSCKVFILNNHKDLLIRIYSDSGQAIHDARVFAHGKRIQYDKSAAAYRDRHSNKKGLLQVVVNDESYFFQLKRKNNNPNIVNSARTVLWDTPVKYIWRPVRFVLFIPVDGIKSIANGYTYGSIYSTKLFFVNSFYACLGIFDGSYYSYQSKPSPFQGYFVTNKPKYHPGDTVKLKAFITGKNYKPISFPIKLEIQQGNKKEIKLTTITPYSSGGYCYEFVLHDSLKIPLDTYVHLRLKKSGRSILNTSFRFENYELASTKLILECPELKQYKNKQFSMRISGKDENNLFLPDAKAEILGISGSVSWLQDEYTFVPDTLFRMNKKLNSDSETELIISDSLFPAADFSYRIVVTMRTTENEVRKQELEVNYHHVSERIAYLAAGDSLQVFYLKNNDTLKIAASFIAFDNFNNLLEEKQIQLPAKIQINNLASAYIVTTGLFEERIAINEISPELLCYSSRSCDSLKLQVNNPRNIVFNYTLYKQNREICRGNGKELVYAEKSNHRGNYFISIQYLWAGKVVEEDYEIPFKKNNLQVVLNAPTLIVPGQKSILEIEVSDQKGKPVANTDITAFGLTRKFNYQIPQLPDFSKKARPRLEMNSFSIDHTKMKNRIVHFDYDTWKYLAGLDSIEYYKFIRPDSGFYFFEVSSNDSITQFSPFVLKDGNFQTIAIIYVDNRPVYFNWVNNRQPYSFRINSGFHEIRIRTLNEEITLIKQYFKAGYKTIISISEMPSSEVKRRVEKKPFLTGYEKYLAEQYTFPYRNMVSNQVASISQGDNYTILNPEISYGLTNTSRFIKEGAMGNRTNLAGPVFPNQVWLSVSDAYSQNFNHEPRFEYEFAPGLIKMRSVSYKSRPFLPYTCEQDYQEYVTTQKTVDNYRQELLDNRRRSKSNNYSNNLRIQGTGNLEFSGNTITEKLPLNILLFKLDDPEFLKIFNGNIQYMNNLESGLYRVFWFLPGRKYALIDSLGVVAGGTNYYKISDIETFDSDEFSKEINQLLERKMCESEQVEKGFGEEDLLQIRNSYHKQFTYFGETRTVTGFITDATGEPLPGASVCIPGTNIGAVSDLDGYYRLEVPVTCSQLSFNYVGYLTETNEINGRSSVNVTMFEDMMALEEVVVIGYGVQKKSSITGNVTSISSNSLYNMPEAIQGRVSGVLAENGFAIRGISVESASRPLILIDGQVFSGDYNELNPDLFSSIDVLKDASATAIYGAQAANGVLVISTKSGKKTMKPIESKHAFSEEFLELSSESSAIRSNFSDYAFWQPMLKTNKEGKVSFEVTFPDDITNWETFVLAMNNHKQTGQTSAQIKSFKPVMGRLYTPSFLIDGDSACLIGKALGYLTDSIYAVSSFQVNSDGTDSNSIAFKNVHIDSLTVKAVGDTMSFSYSVTRGTNYFDGEKRDIPIIKKGLKQTQGQFIILDTDSVFQIPDFPAGTEVYLSGFSGEAGCIEKLAYNLSAYKYNCNEQMASKLLALLALEEIAKLREEKFHHSDDIEKLIRKLTDNQNADGLWGWWNNSSTEYWVSEHVLLALTESKKAGYAVKYNKAEAENCLLKAIDKEIQNEERLQLLSMLNMLGVPVDYAFYFKMLDNALLHSGQELAYMRLKQNLGYHIQMSEVMKYADTTLLGNIHFEYNSQLSNKTLNQLSLNIDAYSILSADSSTSEILLRKIRNYFLSEANLMTCNTFSQSLLLKAILPSILIDYPGLKHPMLIVHNNSSDTITSFPFKQKLMNTGITKIENPGAAPLYLSVYSEFWNVNPSPVSEMFSVETSFDSVQKLFGGKEIKLSATVKVLKDCEYVMIEIPIPAGCSYAEKPLAIYPEIYREYDKNALSVFCRNLKAGSYIFEIWLLPKFTGTYTLNPARVEMMYLPVFQANNGMKKIYISQ